MDGGWSRGTMVVLRAPGARTRRSVEPASTSGGLDPIEGRPLIGPGPQ